MYESLMTFDDYIYEYDLQRAEGLLLRHLSNVHKVLAQTVPDSFKTFEVMEMEQYFKTMIRQVDSSLLEEWEKMRKLSLSPVSQVAQTIDKTGALPEIEIEKEEDITEDHKKFLSDIRNIIFVFLRNWSVGNDRKAIASLESLNDIPDELWETEQYKNMYEELRKSRDDYFKEHSRLSFEPEARNIRHTVVSKKDENVWIIQQTLVDIDGFNDWFAEFVVDIEKSKKVQKPVIKFSKISPIGK